MSERLSGKRAVITGGGSGIGLAISRRFAREGAQVVLLELDEDKGRQAVDELSSGEFSAGATFVRCDIGDHGQVRQAFSEVLEKGPIDILVNNAGIAHIGDVENTTEEDLDRVYRVNVKGVYNGLHAAIGAMVQNGGGAILNLASIASKIGLADRFAYSMSKGAVLTMTLSVAKDYVQKNIRCNCICPARIHTPFVDQYLKDYYPGSEDAMMQTLSEYQPLGRMGRPEEIADLALFLCSDEAKFITGSAYDIDGGVTLLR